MASNFLKEKLSKAANQSPSFQGLALEKQAELIAALENATDQQVMEAIKAFEDDVIAVQKNEIAKQQNEEKLAKSADALDEELKSTKMEMGKVDKKHEEAARMVEIDSAESQIAKLNAPDKKKRKKFLGIF